VGVGSGRAMGEGGALAPISLAFAEVNAIPAPQAVRTSGCGIGVTKNPPRGLGEIITTISCESWAWAAGTLWVRGPRWHPSPWPLQKGMQFQLHRLSGLAGERVACKKYTNGPGGDNHHDLLRVVGVGSGRAMGEGAAVAPISLAFAEGMEFQLHRLSGLAGEIVLWRKIPAWTWGR
jgi:hypothetical protein